MTFNDDLKDSYLFLDTVDQIDYYFMGGHTMDEIIHDYRYLTGKAQMLPKWAYGYVQSKEQYYTAKELLEIVRHYRKIGVPLDCVVQDWNTWDPGNWGEKILDQKRYGDMKECAEEIHKLNAHTMVSVWPNMNAGGKNHTEFFKTGHLLYDYATYDALMKKREKCTGNRHRKDFLTRALIPGGAIPQNRFPVLTGVVQQRESHGKDMSLSAVSTRNIWILLLPMLLH